MNTEKLALKIAELLAKDKGWATMHSVMFRDRVYVTDNKGNHFVVTVARKEDR